MTTLPLPIFFFISFFTLLFQTTLFPTFSLLPFSPFLALILSKKKLLPVLYLSFLSGAVTDLLISDGRGLYSVVFVATSLLLFSKRHFFWGDKINAFFSLTAFISLFTTILIFLANALFIAPIALGAEGFFTSFLVMPLLDGVYGVLFYLVPAALFATLRRKVRWMR